MEKRVISQNNHNKLIELKHNEQTLQVALNHVKTRDVVQARYVDCVEGRITRWKPHGSFLHLIERLLGYKFHGTRQEFLDKLYYAEN